MVLPHCPIRAHVAYPDMMVSRKLRHPDQGQAFPSRFSVGHGPDGYAVFIEGQSSAPAFRAANRVQPPGLGLKGKLVGFRQFTVYFFRIRLHFVVKYGEYLQFEPLEISLKQLMHFFSLPQKSHPMTPIPFHFPYLCGNELATIQEAIQNFETGGSEHFFSKRCEEWLENFTGAKKVLLTSSCTHALELVSILCDIQPGDCILPSFTFVSTANAFALRGARLCFVDVDPKTMNIDPACVEAAINPKTKAIAVIHYGGVSCDLAALRDIADRHGIFLIEDAAHGIRRFF